MGPIGLTLLLGLIGSQSGCARIGDPDDLEHDRFVSMDCAPENPDVHPWAAEKSNGIDDDCDGRIDEGTTGADDDGDGLSEEQGDCNDLEPTISAAGIEVGDGVDQDCDGRVDEGTDWGDDDDDGYTELQGDCDDDDPSLHPGALEICDRIDQDCDGVVDDGFDLDRDGFTTCAVVVDWNDRDPTVFPDAPELCDGRDNDQDGQIDEGHDVDGDGTAWCLGDCDDTDAAVGPHGLEVCNGRDDDCDGFIDGADPDAPDGDQDGMSCERDCDDADPDAFQGAIERADDRDEDCDGLVDEGLDLDGDGHAGDCDEGDPGVHPDQDETCDGQDTNCDGRQDEGYDQDSDGHSTCSGDCDDDDPDVNPGEAERINHADDDCDGEVDQDLGLLVAADMYVELDRNGSHESSLPLPESYEDWAVAVLVDTIQDDGEGWCEWDYDVSTSGGEVHVEVDVGGCKDARGIGHAFRYSVVLFVDAGDDVDLETDELAEGYIDVPDDVALEASWTQGDAVGLCAIGEFFDGDKSSSGGDRDFHWNFQCDTSSSGSGSNRTATLDGTASEDNCDNDHCYVVADMILMAGFDNADVRWKRDWKASKSGGAKKHVSYDTSVPDHLVLVNMLQVDVGDNKDHTTWITEHSQRSSSESFVFREYGSISKVTGDLLILEGRFLYWLDGDWILDD